MTKKNKLFGIFYKNYKMTQNMKNILKLPTKKKNNPLNKQRMNKQEYVWPVCHDRINKYDFKFKKTTKDKVEMKQNWTVTVSLCHVSHQVPGQCLF